MPSMAVCFAAVMRAKSSGMFCAGVYVAEHDAKREISQSFQCSSFRDVVRFESHISASNAASPRSRSHSPVFRAWNAEIVPLSGDTIRIKVDVDASMGQIMNRMAKVAGSKEGRRIERFGRLVLMGTETIESFDCWHAFTRVMLTAQVRALYDRDHVVRFQLVLDHQVHVAITATSKRIPEALGRLYKR